MQRGLDKEDTASSLQLVNPYLGHPPIGQWASPLSPILDAASLSDHAGKSYKYERRTKDSPVFYVGTHHEEVFLEEFTQIEDDTRKCVRKLFNNLKAGLKVGLLTMICSGSCETLVVNPG